MRISLNWLNDYVDIKRIAPTDIAKALTDAGLEVEAIEHTSLLKGDVVVGAIVHAESHPDADTLRVCKVDVGRGDPIDIVCGAPNARAGIKACVALVGSTLPGDFKIKKSKIRGVVSNGMMCAEDELGLSQNHATIIEVDEATALGTSVAEMYGLEDTVLTLGVTPNRGDCLGYLGVARDLSAKLGIPLTYPDYRSVKTDASLSSHSVLTLNVESSDDCSRFCALSIKGVAAVPSPAWMQRRLEASGLRPINAIVDVTNYVMLEYGQPIHAYDERHISKGSLMVRRAKSGESLTTLDKQVRALVETDLLICDGVGPIGLAGVMGGANSEVKVDTTNIVIEVAAFDPKLIRKTAKRLALHTDASHRFERGCDVSVCDVVAWRVGALLQIMASQSGIPVPKIASEMVDQNQGKVELPRIALRTERARQILGLTVLEATRIVDRLEGLGITLIDQTTDKERQLFQIPPWRRDLLREIDLIEEVGRMIGYDEIPFRLPQMEIGATPEQPFIDFVDQSKRLLAGQGFTEVISLPFVGDDLLTKCLIPSDHPWRSSVILVNPLAEQEDRLRPALLLSLLPKLSHNRRHGIKGARLFECGRSYTLPQVVAPEFRYLSALSVQGIHINERASADARCIERTQVAFIFDPILSPKTWDKPERRAGFFDAKLEISRFLGAFGPKGFDLELVGPGELPFLHPGASALVKVGGLVVGYVGELHPEVAKNFDFDPSVPPVFGEVNLDRCFESLRNPVHIDTSERKFPPVNLDLAFVVDKSLTYSAIQDSIKRFNGKRHLREARLFDVYQGDKLATGKKSIAMAFSFQSAKRTLSDKEVDLEVDLLKSWLKQDIGAELR